MNFVQSVEYLCDNNATMTFEKLDGAMRITVAVMVDVAGEREARSCVGSDFIAVSDGIAAEVEKAKKRKLKRKPGR